MIRVHYQVTCDWCGTFKVSCQTCPSEAVSKYLFDGGLCRGELHFCGTRCLNLYRQSRSIALFSTKVPVTGDGSEDA